ncbi:hypothetical protein CROQUDRAFT_656708 [Cronartium quercuum f. sp. fusiforme G11]|uniref:Uncharacterized protein n=1 Tax=Cronartium quercuum f. sp. fusiforme G11 TaxID=708437 RepID=A0A9P6NML5_9BASI|nr:hypothetical protein CROQUDRAFT_656708 [Cronartium quercuum f. sp. fusiforme G11]
MNRYTKPTLRPLHRVSNQMNILIRRTKDQVEPNKRLKLMANLRQPLCPLLIKLGNSLPQLPPRLQPAYLELINNPYPETSRANRSIIRFMRTLSRWFLYGGTLSGIIILLYQRYIFPSLETRTHALTNLTNDGLKSHINILNGLLKVTRSCSILSIKSAKEVEPKQDTPSPSEVKITYEDEQLKPSIDPPAQHYRAHTHQSLRRLSDLLRRREMNKVNEILEDNQELEEKVLNNSSPISVTRSLSQTLERLRKEFYLVNSNRHDCPRSYHYISPLFSEPEILGKSTQIIFDQSQKVVNEFRSELRDLKGMLLNQRNFASWN